MHTSDIELAQALDLARKCGVVVVQNRHGGISCYEKRRVGKIVVRGKEVGGNELKRRLARTKE